MKEIHFWYKWKKYTFGRNKINTLGELISVHQGNQEPCFQTKSNFNVNSCFNAKYVETGLEYFRMKRYYANTPLKTKIGYFGWMKMNT